MTDVIKSRAAGEGEVCSIVGPMARQSFPEGKSDGGKAAEGAGRVRFKLHKGQRAIRDRGIGIHLRSLASPLGNEGK